MVNDMPVCLLAGCRCWIIIITDTKKILCFVMRLDGWTLISMAGLLFYLQWIHKNKAPLAIKHTKKRGDG